MASVKLLAFAGARDAIGAAELAIELEGAESARAFLARIVDRFPTLAPYRGALRVAVNGAYAAWDDPVSPGDEVALIPPVAGGGRERGRRMRARMLVLAATLGCAACGAPQARPTGWRTTLAEESPTLLDSFARHARAAGCVDRVDGPAVEATCDGHAVRLEQREREVIVTCVDLSFDACHALFDRVSATPLPE